MRLICPNCGAQYEVPTEVIPETGRDVQCSDCGSTWFQHHPDHAPEDLVEEETAAPATDPAPSSDPHWQDDADDYGAEPDDADHYDPDSYAPDSAEDDGDDASSEEEYFPAAHNDDPPAEPKRREIDPAVADVLREEAEREYRARAMDNRGTVETQQELGLQDTDNDAQRRSEEARARMARLRGEPEAQKTEAEVDDIDPSSRSNLLPDIDEINSSLDSDGKKEESRSVSPTQDVTAVPGKSGFRAGFRLAIVLAVLALVLYVFAPQLAEAVPQMAGLLSGYVDTVNGWRAGLNDLIQNMASSLSETDASGG